MNKKNCLSSLLETYQLKIGKAEMGLTFSFPATKTFYPGAKYHYLVGKNEIVIYPGTGVNERVVSRKKTKSREKALFDIRNRKIHDFIRGADGFDIEVSAESIIVHCIRKSKISFINQEKKRFSFQEYLKKKETRTIIIPKTLLRPVLKKHLEITGIRLL